MQPLHPKPRSGQGGTHAFGQRFFTVAEMSMLVWPADFVFLSARLSFSDLPDFLGMELRGDLSDIGLSPFSAKP